MYQLKAQSMVIFAKDSSDWTQLSEKRLLVRLSERVEKSKERYR
jgi:hypothetical protein